LGAEFGLGQEAGAMHEIGFERMKERFHVSVVPWSAATGQALKNTQDSEAIPKGGAGILAAADPDLVDSGGSRSPQVIGILGEKAGRPGLARYSRAVRARNPPSRMRRSTRRRLK
jgi:hypothetical protein